MPRKTKHLMEPPTVTCENGHFYRKGELFIPKIFEVKHLGDAVPKGFNAVMITIDGRVTSSLDWKKIHQEVSKYVKEGLLILWDLNLGLFHELSFSLTNETQYRSLCISTEHFFDSLWHDFHAETLGLILYRGGIDFTTLPWDDELDHNLQDWLKDCFYDVKTFNQETGSFISDFEEADHSFLSSSNEVTQQLLLLFCRDVAVEYLHILIDLFPHGLEAFALIDCASIDNPLQLAELLNKECFTRIHLAIKNCNLSHQEITWGNGSSPQGYIADHMVTASNQKEIKVGICLPPAGLYRPTAYSGLGEALRWLNEENVAYKLIPESMLAAEWDGLDSLFVVPGGVTNTGLRMLKGFCAAGGTVVTVTDVALGLPFEVTWSEWKKFRDRM